jgi:hypothetical protein
MLEILTTGDTCKYGWRRGDSLGGLTLDELEKKKDKLLCIMKPDSEIRTPAIQGLV